MNRSTFHLVDKDGIKISKEGNQHLACLAEDGEIIALWGSPENTRNIDMVEAAGFPCTVTCQWRQPSTWAQDKLGHTHWVPESAELEIVLTIHSNHSNEENLMPTTKPAQLSLADRIREHALHNHVLPARQSGRQTLAIKAGDVHREMNLTSRVPAVCGALGSNKFLELAGLESLKTTGPTQSTTTVYYYSLK